MALRMASSVCRVAARASIRFATFTHAISNTKPTTPSSANMAGFTRSTPYSFTGITRMVLPAFDSG
jgi:hypothetical protein